MSHIHLTDSEMAFMNLVWEKAPIGSMELVRLADEAFGWKKSTTYTIIRRLKQKGILQNQQSIVTPLVEKQAVQESKRDDLLGKVYNGSVKMFLASFLQKQSISKKEAEEIRQMIQAYIEEGE